MVNYFLKKLIFVNTNLFNKSFFHINTQDEFFVYNNTGKHKNKPQIKIKIHSKKITYYIIP